MDFAKFKAVLQRSNDCLEKWLALQETAARLYSNAGNILNRLPILSERRNFSGLPNSEQLQQLVLAKQLKALEAVFGRIQTNLSEAEAVVGTQERLVVEAWRLLGEAPGAEACAAVQPGGVSVAQLVECLEDVGRMCRDDLAVLAAARSCLTHTTSPQEFESLDAARKGAMGLLVGSYPVILMQSAASALR
ncbi:hypothetical protein Agub_g4914 [Astrephomene gubernaculifera]|uniref:Uncharacterized protein n=1 Tax=Astrephomene gubernaculifera TaxID=47775 RepID=A0AAD3DNN4_9CHLO|nr:hypothetical protein Agub_g4914 [Astrephomene gubernaculifera]